MTRIYFHQKEICNKQEIIYQKFGKNRVFDVPLAEEATTGIGIGASLNGLYPLQTHIRADFALVCMNQIINLASKYRYMFGGSFEVPMLIRLVVGPSWGQGAQHSQSLQSTFSHFPGLTVIMPSHPDTILSSYLYAAETYKNPGDIVVLEKKDIAGPIKIAKISGSAIDKGIIELFIFMAVMSINLGLINLLPIPVLDGGHIMMNVIEKIRGKPLSEKNTNLMFQRENIAHLGQIQHTCTQYGKYCTLLAFDVRWLHTIIL